MKNRTPKAPEDSPVHQILAHKDELMKPTEEPMSGTEMELMLLRTKLEIRSWMLRFSLALNAGVLVKVIDHFFF